MIPILGRFLSKVQLGFHRRRSRRKDASRRPTIDVVPTLKHKLAKVATSSTESDSVRSNGTPPGIIADDTSPETHGTSNEDASSGALPIASRDPPATAQYLSSAPAVATTNFRSKAYDDAYLELAIENESVLNQDDAKKLLDRIDEEYDSAVQEKPFLRGILKVQKAQPFFEGFDFVLKLISLVSVFHPAASTAIGVVEIVTKIAIAVSKTKSKLGERQVTMAQKLNHVYQCEHLSDGQSGDPIFKSLVRVYRSLLEYYIEAHEIFKKNSVKMAISLCGDNESLSDKVKIFDENVQYLDKDVSLFTANQAKAAAARELDEKVSKRLVADALSTQYGYHDKLQMVREDKACSVMVDADDIYTHLFTKGKHGVVITGSIGCGKSVIMSFLVDQFFEKSKEQPSNEQLSMPIICSYYCWDDNSGNLLSILRGLILAILGQATNQKRDFEEWCEGRRYFSLGEPINSPIELEIYLRLVAKRLDRPVLLAIDGLDECDEASRTSLLTLLEELSGEADHVKYLLTSRTDVLLYPRAEQGIHRVPLQPGLKRDRLIVEKEINEKMTDYSEEVKQFVSKELSAKARGCAVWIRMVVSTLRSSRITIKEGMEAFLRETPLPEELSKMYQNLFCHCTAGYSSNMDLAWSALKILASARRDLTLKELAWGASMANARPSDKEISKIKIEADCDRILHLIRPFITELHSSVTTGAASSVENSTVGRHKFRTVCKAISMINRRQILSNHCTEAESEAEFETKPGTESDATFDANSEPDPDEKFNTKIRLGHKSVKEFVIAYGAASGSDIAGVQTSIPASIFLPEHFMLNVCIKYLLLKDINEKCLFTESDIAAAQLLQPIDQRRQNTRRTTLIRGCTITMYERNLPKYIPKECDFGGFFVYASCYWIDHMAKAEPPATPALEDLEKLCKYKSQRLDNWTKQICRPNCTLRPRYKLDSAEFDPLLVAAFYLPKSVLVQVLQQGDFNGGCYGEDALFTAPNVLLQNSDKFSRLKALLASHHSSSKNDVRMLECFKIILKKWGEVKHRYEVEDNQCASLDSQKGPTTERYDDLGIKEEHRKDWDGFFGLVEEKADIMAIERWANDLFCLAASQGCMPIVQRLIQTAKSKRRLRAAIWGTKRHPASVLSASAHQSVGSAAANGDRRMVEFLLRHKEARAHLCYTDAEGRTVLHMTAQRCEPGIVRTLLLQLRVGGFFLVSRVDANGRPPAETALHSNAAEVDRDEAQQLLEDARRSHFNARLRAAIWVLIWMLIWGALASVLLYSGVQFALTLLVWWVTKRRRMVSLQM